MFSEKGKNLVLRDDFKFRFHKPLADDVQRWACTDKKCKAFMKRSSTGCIIDDSKADEHNHEPPPPEVLQKQRVSNGLKRKALDDVSERPSKMMARELDETSTMLTGNDLPNFRKSIYRQRREVYPPFPKTLAELHALSKILKRA